MKRLFTNMSEQFWMWLFFKSFMKLGYRYFIPYEEEIDGEEQWTVIHIANDEATMVKSMTNYIMYYHDTNKEDK